MASICHVGTATTRGGLSTYEDWVLDELEAAGHTIGAYKAYADTAGAYGCDVVVIHARGAHGLGSTSWNNPGVPMLVLGRADVMVDYGYGTTVSSTSGSNLYYDDDSEIAWTGQTVDTAVNINSIASTLFRVTAGLDTDGLVVGRHTNSSGGECLLMFDAGEVVDGVTLTAPAVGFFIDSIYFQSGVANAAGEQLLVDIVDWLAAAGVSDVTVDAGMCTVSVAASAPLARATVPAGTSSVSVAAYSAAVRVSVAAGAASVSVAASAATARVAVPAGTSSVTVAASAPTVRTTTTAPACAVTVAAYAVAPTVTVPAGTSSVTVAAYTASAVVEGDDVTANAGTCTVSVAAHDVAPTITAAAGAGAVTVSAHALAPSVTLASSGASVTVAAHAVAPTVTAAVGAATVTVTGYTAAPTVVVAPSAATVTVTGYAPTPTVSVTVGTATVTVAGYTVAASSNAAGNITVRALGVRPRDVPVRAVARDRGLGVTVATSIGVDA